MKIAGYDIDLLVVGFTGKSVCHGRMGWSTIALLRGGILLPEALVRKIRALCDDAHVPFMLVYQRAASRALRRGEPRQSPQIARADPIHSTPSTPLLS